MALWIATFAVWLVSLALILVVMAGVSRRDPRMRGPVLVGGVAAHGVTAILVLVLFFQALAS